MNKLPIHKMMDHSHKIPALRLANRIRDYWAARGHSVKVEPVQALDPKSHTLRNHGAVWMIRSNMVDGLPNKNPSAPIFIAKGEMIVPRSDGDQTAPHPPQTASGRDKI